MQEPGLCLADPPMRMPSVVWLLQWILCLAALCLGKPEEIETKNVKKAMGSSPSKGQKSSARWGGGRRWCSINRRKMQPSVEAEEEEKSASPQAWETEAALLPLRQKAQSSVMEAADQTAMLYGKSEEAVALILCLRHWMKGRGRVKRSSNGSWRRDQDLQDSTEQVENSAAGSANPHQDTRCRAYGTKVLGTEVEIRKVWMPELDHGRTQSVIGDGNCFWRAAAKGMGTRWGLLKKATIAHAREKGDLDWCTSNQQRGKWISNAGVKHFADAFGLEIFINTGRGTTWSIKGGDRAKLYLKLRHAHYAVYVNSKERRMQSSHDDAEEEVALQGGAPKKRKSPRPAEEERKEGRKATEVMEVQMFNRDDTAERWSIRLPVGARVASLFQAAATRLGTAERNILLYRSRSNILVGRSLVIERHDAFEYATTPFPEEDTEESQESQHAGELQPEQAQQEEAKERQQQDKEAEELKVFEGRRVDWKNETVALTAQTYNGYLVLNSDGDWIPYVLWSDTSKDKRKEIAFLSGLLAAEESRIVLHQASQREANEYGCPKGLYYAFTRPLPADLRAKEEARQRDASQYGVSASSGASQQPSDPKEQEPQSCNLEGGAPKGVRDHRSRSPRRAREPDFNLAPEEGWTVDIKLQDRDDYTIEDTVRAAEGVLVRRVATIAADRLGVEPSSVLIYRGITNEILSHEAAIHTSCELQYCKAEEDEQQEETDQRCRQDAEASEAEEEHDSDEQEEEEQAEESEEEEAIPWEAISVTPVTNTHDYFLVFFPFHGWRPFILRSNNRENWDLERAFCARMLRVEVEEVVMHEATPELARRYGCVRTLMLVFPAPTRADLTGGGKSSKKERKGLRLRLRSSSQKSKRKAEEDKAERKRRQLQQAQIDEQIARMFRLAEEKKDRAIEEEAEEMLMRGEERRMQQDNRARASTSGGNASRQSQHDEPSSSPPPCPPRKREVLTAEDVNDTPWLLRIQGDLFCMPCRKWATAAHLLSDKHERQRSWITSGTEQEQADFYAQRQFEIQQKLAAEEEKAKSKRSIPEPAQAPKRGKKGVWELVAEIEKEKQQALGTDAGKPGSSTDGAGIDPSSASLEIDAKALSTNLAAYVGGVAGPSKESGSLSKVARGCVAAGVCGVFAPRAPAVSPSLSPTLPFGTDDALPVDSIIQEPVFSVVEPQRTLQDVEKYDQESLNAGLMWIEIRDETYSAQGVPETAEIFSEWGSCCVRFSGHLRLQEVSEILNARFGISGARAACMSDRNCIRWDTENLSLASEHITQMLWQEHHPVFWGGGEGSAKGYEQEQVAKALNKIRQFQQNILAPQHLRILLMAKPFLVDKVLRADSADAIATAIKREARQARLPLQEPSRAAAGEEEKQPAALPKKTGRGVSAPAAPRGGMQGKGAASSDPRSASKGAGSRGKGSTGRAEGAATPRQGGSKGKGSSEAGHTERRELPTSFTEDWAVPILKSMLPGTEEGILLTESMKEAKKVMERMKGAKGRLAIVSLDKLEGEQIRQKQIPVNLGVKSGGAYKVHTTQVWLIQVGDGEVQPQQTVQTVSIKPAARATMVTALNVIKKEAKQDILKQLAAKETDKLAEKIKEGLDEQHRSAVDIFAIKDDGSCYYGLIRYAADARDRLLRLSGDSGIYIKTPKEDMDKFAVAWLPGDTGRQVALAQEVLKGQPNHRGLVHGKAGIGVRAEKAEVAKMREAQGQETAPAYLVKGLPPQMTKQELEQALRAITWNCRVEEAGRRMAKGGATWKVHSDEEPAKASFAMNYGYLRCTIYIQELGASAKPVDEESKYSTQFPAPKTWAEAVAPKTQRPLSKEQLRHSKEEAEEVEEEETPAQAAPAASVIEQETAEPPEGKRRRTENQQQEHDRHTEARFARLEQRQASIDAQLGQILAILAGQAAGSPPHRGGSLQPFRASSQPASAGTRTPPMAGAQQALPSTPRGAAQSEAAITPVQGADTMSISSDDA